MPNYYYPLGGVDFGYGPYGYYRPLKTVESVSVIQKPGYSYTSHNVEIHAREKTKEKEEELEEQVVKTAGQEASETVVEAPAVDEVPPPAADKVKAEAIETLQPAAVVDDDRIIFPKSEERFTTDVSA